MRSLNRAALNMSGAMLGLVVLCGGTGIWAAWQQSAALETQQGAASLLRNHMEADMMHDAIRADVLAALQASNPASGLAMKDVKADLAEHLDMLKKGIDADSAYDGSEDVSRVTGALAAPMADYTEAARKIVDIADSNPNAALSRLPEFFTQFRTLEGSMANASAAINKHAEQVTQDGAGFGRFAIGLLALTLLAGIAAAVGLSIAVRRHLVSPLLSLVEAMRTLASGNLKADIPHDKREDELGEMAKAMAAFRDQLHASEASKEEQTKLIVSSIGSGLVDLARGDLTSRINANLTGPFERLKTDFNDALEKLSELIGSVSETATSIRTGSGEIAQASEDLARRTEANAASLEETSAAVAQMDERLKATAAAAHSTVERADGAIGVVGSGRSLAVEAVDAMGRVSESAKGIDSVIEGLDKIAFQTRVLAMNAAVEAGRAGDAGRGFAVVADLVSALAMRAEEEAKRARDQLTVTQTDIVTAVEAVQKVDGALENISTDVGAVHALLGRIAADNQAQSSTITQISAAVSTMDQSTQQNAAMVEETSAASRNLFGEVNALTDKAAMFQVSKVQRSASHTPAQSKAPKHFVPQAPRNSASSGYVSPVKALSAAGADGVADDNWTDF